MRVEPELNLKTSTTERRSQGERIASWIQASLLISLAGTFACTYTTPSSDGAAASLLNSLGVAQVVAAATANSAPAVSLDSMESAFVSGGGGRASTNWTWTSTVDGKYTVRKDAGGCTDGSVMVGPNDVAANVANAGPTINAIDLNVGANNFALCVYYNDDDDVEQTVSATFTVTRDDTAPTAPTSTPADASGSISPALGTITLVFGDTMDTASTPTITATTSGTILPTDGTTFTWTDANTLKIKLSWVYFPENVTINWTVTAAGLQDAAGNALGSAIARTFSTTANNASFSLADSGQNECYGTTGGSNQSCPHATLLGQDGETVHPTARSFTGPTAHSTYTSDYTTKDNVTGLTWASCVVGKSGAACGTGSFTSFTWYTASNACKDLNAMNSGAGYAGITSWRLPSMAERMTITDNSGWYPALDTSAFPNSPAGGSRVWTSTGDVANNNFAHEFYIGPSQTSRTSNKTTARYVRCVSGTGTARSFTDHLDGTITDNNTGLKWTKCPFGSTYTTGTCSGAGTSTNWSTALSSCLGMGGTWRLATLNEHLTIMDWSRHNPAMDPTYFVGHGRYWTSTTYNGSHGQAFAAQTDYGYIYRETKTLNLRFRCVSN